MSEQYLFQGEIDALGVGDEVGVCRHSGRSAAYSVAVVERRTSTQVILKDGRRFTRHNKLVGETPSIYTKQTLCSAGWARGVQEREAAEAKRRDLIRRVELAPWNRLTDDQLAEVAALLDAIAARTNLATAAQP